MVLMLLTFGALAAEPCADPDRLMSRATSAVNAYSFAEVDVQLREAELAFACAGPATSEQAARLHVIQAARFGFDERPESRDASLASAKVADPAYFEERFGPELKARWEAVAPSGSGSGSGELRLPGLPAGWVLRVDGRVAMAPAEVTVGPHLIQLGPSESDVRFAKLVNVSYGGSLVVDIPTEIRGEGAKET